MCLGDFLCDSIVHACYCIRYIITFNHLTTHAYAYTLATTSSKVIWQLDLYC